MCRHKVAQHECRFYENFDRNFVFFCFLVYLWIFFTGQRQISRTISLCEDSPKVSDLEDLINVGRRHHVCPYYLARENFESANLLLLPYNYILDPGVRKANKIDVTGSIVIFDEGHNLVIYCTRN